MKRIFSVLFACLLLCGLAACFGGGREENPTTSPEPTSVQTEEKTWPTHWPPEGVEYIEAFELQSDPGDNLSAEGGAEAAFSAMSLIKTTDFYNLGDAVTITLTGMDTLDGMDVYLYTIKTPRSETKHAVNYNGVVYWLPDGEDEYTRLYGSNPGEPY